MPYYLNELQIEEVLFDVVFDCHIRHKLSEAATQIASLSKVDEIDLSYDKNLTWFIETILEYQTKIFLVITLLILAVPNI